MAGSKYIAPAGAAAVAFGVFVALAQTHVIFVPYFTQAVLKVQELAGSYDIGEPVRFVVTAEGYGSNCHSLEVQAVHEGERASYFKRADDCRFMEITHGQYNMTRSFEYGSEVGQAGQYTVEIKFEDLVDGTKAVATKTFEVQAGQGRNLTLDLNENLGIEGNPR
ncbi:hypothetical protein [Candidatus Nitrososphaera sp. FF02]|uniref:hypothetical protein n=1 Tax=Candidatus Nitrososphaera sp. FF02 TaxID=3398226 RepID=UPI0039ECC855